MKYLCGILEPGTEGGFPSGDNGGGLPPGSFLESLSFFLELRLPPAPAIKTINIERTPSDDNRGQCTNGLFVT